MFQEINTAASELPSITTLPSFSLPTPSTITTTPTALHSPKSTSSKRNYSDDDDDYVPPTKTNNLSCYEDSDSDYEISVKKPRRGRPPKKATSSTPVSGVSGGGGGGKYREMRDKNNEASRRSRMKRRVKELKLEDEAEELAERNIKLKARVSQLERTVNNFRTNVMSLLMKK